MSFDEADEVAPGDVGVEPEEQVRRGERKEVQRVRLEHLPRVHQSPQLQRRRRRNTPDDLVERLRRAQVVRHRTDAAEALHDDGHFPVRPERLDGDATQLSHGE